MSLRNPSLSICLAALAAALSGTSALAAPPVKTSAGGNDGQFQYTVKVDSKRYGASQETRKIRSGEIDDFNWKSVPPSGAVAMPDGCPDADSAPRDANGAMVRQTQVRLAPAVDAKGVATVQVSFQASAPDGTASVTTGGKTLQCPKAVTVSEVRRVSIPIKGGAKTLVLRDGTRVTISIHP
ncbi:DUF6013 family protein [Burkholderia glumae]|uniref:DUF6013 family protein n=1 Tax=Burkholderia glumae TaxID=337 RepID=UPI002037153B|nr:DUF6013 family protein [Burkholderia glumae]MCM2493085.1 DUF6013 family protein [Burkholderia glumae]MCM2544230.1 DUF6013 family protein [Burkholderia glumae]